MSSPSILSFNEKTGVLPLDVESLGSSPRHERPLEQPARPRCADASPLGLLAFATGGLSDAAAFIDASLHSSPGGTFRTNLAADKRQVSSSSAVTACTREASWRQTCSSASSSSSAVSANSSGMSGAPFLLSSPHPTSAHHHNHPTMALSPGARCRQGFRLTCARASYQRHRLPRHRRHLLRHRLPLIRSLQFRLRPHLPPRFRHPGCLHRLLRPHLYLCFRLRCPHHPRSHARIHTGPRDLDLGLVHTHLHLPRRRPQD